jgi:hypothetical protein
MNTIEGNDMSATTLGIHDTLPRPGAKSPIRRRDWPAIDPQEIIKRTPQIFKAARQVIVDWSDDPSFHAAIQSTCKSKFQGSQLTQTPYGRASQTA